MDRVVGRHQWVATHHIASFFCTFNQALSFALSVTVLFFCASEQLWLSYAPPTPVLIGTVFVISFQHVTASAAPPHHMCRRPFLRKRRLPWIHHLKLATVSSIIRITFSTTFSTTFSPTKYSYHYRRLRRVCNLYYHDRFPPGLWVIRQKSVRLWSCVPLQDSLSVGAYYRLLRGLGSQYHYRLYPVSLDHPLAHPFGLELCPAARLSLSRILLSSFSSCLQLILLLSFFPWSLGSLVSFYKISTRSAGREGVHHVFTIFLKSIYDGRGNGNAEERRGEERATREVLLVCFCLLA
jgi:hypothetical protein